MSIPTNREEFTLYCMRKLGHEVIKINMSSNQIQDRIDEAILFFQDFSSDGTERQMYKYQITPTDMSNRFITLPDNIIGAVSIFPPGDAFNTTNIFNIRYQIALNDLYTLTSVSVAPYYMAFSHLQLLEQILVGNKPIRFNRISSRLYLDMDWTNLTGGFLIIDCFQVVDPTLFPKLWGDRILAKLATAYIKNNWGENLSKFGNVQMAGGVYLNGGRIKQEAQIEIQQVENEIRTVYEMPALPEIG